MNIVKIIWWVDWFEKERKSFIDWISIDFDEQKNRLLIECRLISTNKKIDYWKIVIFANSRSFSLIHDTSNENKMQSSFSKKNLFIHANSRSFSLIHVVSWKFVLLFHSRRFVLWFRDLFRENSRFVDLKMLYVNFSFNSRKFVLLLRDLFLKKLHILTILFYLFAYLDEQSVSTKRLTNVN